MTSQDIVSSSIATWFGEPLSTGAPHTPHTKNHLWHSAAAFFLLTLESLTEESASHELLDSPVLPHITLKDIENTIGGRSTWDSEAKLQMSAHILMEEQPVISSDTLHHSHYSPLPISWSHHKVTCEDIEDEEEDLIAI